MVRKYSVAQAKAELADVLRFVEEGNQAIIQRRGKSVVTLTAWKSDDEASPSHWSEALWGVARDIDDLEPILKDVIRASPAGSARAAASPG
jgi:antitoxin (DNA-binding transcriptional repressor) of toxin-antitoxin stability system